MYKRNFKSPIKVALTNGSAIKIFVILTIIVCWVDYGFSQEYPQVTKIKQKCYEIFDKTDQSTQETKKFVYKRIDYICDSIVKASVSEFPYIDLQIASKKQIVAQAKIMATQDLAKYKEEEKLRLEAIKKAQEEERLRLEAEAAKAKEMERLRLEAEAERAREKEKLRLEAEAKNRRKEILLASIPAAKEKALSLANKHEDIFPVEAYQMCNDIFDMYINGALRHIKTKTANGVEYMGWVDLSGLPYGIAKITKPINADVENVYTGIFYKGKPICGELKIWTPTTKEKYSVHGFINLQKKPYNSKPTYVRYQQNGYHIMRKDGNGSVDGICIDSEYSLMKNSTPIVKINHHDTEKVLKQLYNYFIQQHPQTSTKVVENFPLNETFVYTGGWKDGEPDGVGVIKRNYNEYEYQNVINGVVANSIWLRGNYPPVYEMHSNNNEGYVNLRVEAEETNGLLFPHNNNGIGLMSQNDLRTFTLATIRLHDSISITPTQVPDKLIYNIINRCYVESDSGYVFFCNVDIDGKYIDYAGIGAHGTFTIEQLDKASQKLHIRILGKTGIYFEGHKLSDNSYVGVLYGDGNYIYVGYVDDKLNYKGEGYLLDPTDGTIMRQGIWDKKNLTESRHVKNNINNIYPTIISEILAKNKEVLNKKSIKLAPSVIFNFPSFQK